MRKFKRLIIALLACTLLVPTAYATGGGTDFYEQLAELISRQDSTHYFSTMLLTTGSLRLWIDGKEQLLDTTPEIREGYVMLPIRPIAEAVGVAVEFIAETSSVRITCVHGEVTTFPIGGDSLQINSASYPMKAPSYAKNGRTYLSLESVAATLGLEFQWDGETSTVTFTAPYQTARLLAHAETLDAGALGAKTVLTDGHGFWVLQFRTPAQARQALQTLTEQGIDAEPDLYVTAEL